MAQGISLHIGMNHIDPAVYGPGNDLAGCENDARSMQTLAVASGFQTTLMLNEQATAATVIQAIAGAGSSLRAGDIFLVSYSGHGSQVPDKNGDEPDGQDETWCLYDRMLIDDELSQLWSQFCAGARIFMLSDSCHSGTVARMVIARDLARSPAVAEHYRGLVQAPPLPFVLRAIAAGPPRTRDIRRRAATPPASAADLSRIQFRLLPPASAERAYRAAKDLYDTQQLLTGPASKATVAASVILISGCQDNQLCADGSTNGLFTEKLLKVWNSGSFTGDYKQFHQQICAQMPMTQTPNYFKDGAADPVFETQKPFTVTVDATNEPVAASLWVKGPATLNRTEAAPTFRVNPGPNSYYVFEITPQADLFDTGNNRSRRTDDNFYGSYSDSPHLTGTEYTLPDAVWTRLKGADTLYYRIGSTATSEGWTNYMVSTPDQQYASAPSISLQGAAEGTGESGGTGESEGTGESAGTGESEGTGEAGGTGATAQTPTITGPETIAADDPAPTFSIGTAGAPYFVVEVATASNLFDTDAHESERTDDTFFGSWSDGSVLTDTSYTLPDAIWKKLSSGSALYYRVGTTTSKTGWENYTVSVEDTDSANAPSIEITAAKAFQRKAG